MRRSVCRIHSCAPNETKLSGERKRVRCSDPLGADEFREAFENGVEELWWSLSEAAAKPLRGDGADLADLHPGWLR